MFFIRGPLARFGPIDWQLRGLNPKVARDLKHCAQRERGRLKDIYNGGTRITIQVLPGGEWLHASVENPKKGLRSKNFIIEAVRTLSPWPFMFRVIEAAFVFNEKEKQRPLLARNRANPPRNRQLPGKDTAPLIIEV